MKKNVFKWILPLVVLLNACKKDDNVTTTVIPPVVVDTVSKGGEYVLSEGGPGSNNTKLTYRVDSSGNIIDDYFLQQNPSMTGGLGDIGNDAVIYGSKLYVVMNGSNNVTVLNAKNAAYITSISIPFGPRFAIGYNGKLYVTVHDASVKVIDTATYAITNSISVGPDPEGLVAVGNYLYVANSGGYNPIPDSTLSVIDLNTNLEIQKIKICLNPQKVEANSLGILYISGYGDFVSVPATISVVSSATKTLITTLDNNYSYNHLRIYNDTAYLYNNYGGIGTCKMLNTINNTTIRNEFITDATVITTPYGVNIDPKNGDVYITDAKDYTSPGEVTCFGRDGRKKFSFTTGVSPNSTIFLR